MDTQAFYRIPTEIWEKIIASLGRSDLAALALVSRRTYPLTNPLLYKVAEISLCKCSDRYLTALEYTMSTSKTLAGIVRTFFVDMSITCHLKPCSTSLEDLQSAKWHDKLKWKFPRPVVGINPGPSGSREVANGVRKDVHVNWHHDSMQVLQQNSVKQILRSLWSLENITIILGRYYHETDILRILLNELPPQILNQVKHLKLRDLTIAHNPRMQYFTSLRYLDLGYVTVVNAEFCDVLASNSDTLEDLRLSWIVEASQLHLLAGASSDERGAGKVVPLPHLKSFRSKGPHCFSLEGLKIVFSETKDLEDLHLDSLSHAAALVWANMMNHMIEADACPFTSLRGVSFGGPVNCSNFWNACAKLITNCGAQLKTISMNGSPKGAKTPFPQSFKDCFSGGMPVQPNLERLNLVWRDEVGVDEDTIQHLHIIAPSVEFIHLTMEFPLLDSVNRLLDLLHPFHQLRQLHLIFPLHNDNAPAHLLISDAKLRLDLEGKGGMCREFATKMVDLLPSLEYLSWSMYEFFHPGDQPAFFIKIKRSEENEIQYEDLGQQYSDYTTSSRGLYRASIGSKRVQFSQKPTWREDMGNSLIERGLACTYADYLFADENSQLRRD